jgi:hypothetical protein
MLYGGSYTTRFTSEESVKRNLQLFANWTPPAGFEFKFHWARADGKGGVFVAEADSAAAALEAVSPWVSRMDFDLAPLVDIAEAVPIWLKIFEWQDSIS